MLGDHHHGGEVAAMSSTSLGGYSLSLLFVFEEAERVEQRRGVDGSRPDRKPSHVRPERPTLRVPVFEVVVCPIHRRWEGGVPPNARRSPAMAGNASTRAPLIWNQR